MSFFINPMRGSDKSIARSEKVDKPSTAKVTAEKVEQVVQLPVTKQSREVRLLSDTRELSRKIQRDWNLLEPSELAEQIVDLEGKVALLEGTSAAIEKIRKVAQKLHFQFVFPVVLELSSSPDPKMPASFARVIHNAAKRVFESQSLAPLKEFNSVQINEILREAKGRG